MTPGLFNFRVHSYPRHNFELDPVGWPNSYESSTCSATLTYHQMLRHWWKPQHWRTEHRVGPAEWQTICLWKGTGTKLLCADPDGRWTQQKTCFVPQKLWLCGGPVGWHSGAWILVNVLKKVMKFIKNNTNRKSFTGKMTVWGQADTIARHCRSFPKHHVNSFAHKFKGWTLTGFLQV